MTVAELLHDASAEHACAGMAVLSHHGALTMADVIDDLYDPRAARIIDAARGITVTRDRVELVADQAHVDALLLAEWVAETPVMWDTSGAVRARVRDAAARRLAIYQAVNQLEAITGLPVRFGDAA